MARLTTMAACAAALISGVAVPPGVAQDSGSTTISKTVPANPVGLPAKSPPAQGAAPAERPAAAAPAPAPAAPEGQAAAATPPSGGWDFATMQTGEPQPFTGRPEQIALIQKINEYFNGITNLEGTFLQTDPDDKKKKGKFFIERPGKALFDYASPSKLRIVSDGKYLAVEDHDLETADRYPLESTPFRLILARDVDFLKTAKIRTIDLGKDALVINLEEKDEGTGQVWLVFNWPEIALREWMIRDAQGLSTKIEVAALTVNKAVSPKLFSFSERSMPNFRE